MICCSNPQTDRARVRRQAASQLGRWFIRLAFVAAMCKPHCQQHLQFAAAADTSVESTSLDGIFLLDSLARRVDNPHESMRINTVVDKFKVAEPSEDVHASFWPRIISRLINVAWQPTSRDDRAAGTAAVRDPSTPLGSGKFRAEAQAACGDPGVFCPSVNTSATITCFPGMYTNVAPMSN